MRKLNVCIMTLLLGVSIVKAAGSQSVSQENWSGVINVDKLSGYLKLDARQSEEVNDICSYFSRQVECANQTQKLKNEKMKKAVYANLKLMKRTLTAEQYAKYRTLLNVTLNNKGIQL